MMSWSMNWPKKVVPAVCVGIVRVRRREREVDDQILRPAFERVTGVERATRLAELEQRGGDALARLGERPAA